MDYPLTIVDKLVQCQQLWHQPGGVPWGFVPFRFDQFSTNHRLVVGMPGGGKTLIFSLLMLSELPIPGGNPSGDYAHRNSRESVYQSVVYNAKSEQIPRLMALGFTPGVDLFVFNPFDIDNGMVWDIARDINDFMRAEDFADLVVSNITKPEQHSGTSEHFQETARSVVIEVVQVLLTTSHWTLRDFINCFSSQERIVRVLEHHPQDSQSLGHIRDSEEGRSTVSTIKRHIRKFILPAACWDAIKQRHGSIRVMSLSDWVANGEGTVLLLPDGHDYPAITKPFNRFIMQRLKYLLMQKQERQSGRRRTLFFDELPTAGRIDVLAELLNKGRDYGISITLGIQDIGQMRLEYGKEETDTITNACGFKAYLKCKGTMAEWCANQIGRQTIQYLSLNVSASQSRSDGESQSFKEHDRVWLPNHTDSASTSSGHSVVRNEQFALMPATFHQMQDIKNSGEFPGIYEAPNGEIWEVSIPLHDLLYNDKGFHDLYANEKKLRSTSDVREPTPDEQILRPMTKEDCRRLGLKSSVVGTSNQSSTTHHRKRRQKQRTPLETPVIKRPPSSFS